MLTLMTIILIILSILLILVVLIQPGKGDMVSGMGSLGGTFSNMFGSRRATDLLTKFTIGLASAIMVLALITNLFFVGQEQQIQRPSIEGMNVPNQQQQVPPQIPTQAPPAQQQGGQQNNQGGQQNDQGK